MLTRVILSSFLAAMLSGFALGQYDFDQERKDTEAQERKDEAFKVNVEIAVKHVHGGRFDEAGALCEKLYRQIDDDYRRLLEMIRASEGWKQPNDNASRLLEKKQDIFTSGFCSAIWRFFDIGVAYAEQDRFAEAEEVHRNLISIYERIQPPAGRSLDRRDAPDFLCTLGAEHIGLDRKIFSVRYSLAKLYRQQGRYVEAGALFKDILSFGEDRYDKSSSDLASIVLDFSILCLYQGRYTEAELLGRRAHTMLRRLLGEDNPLTIDALKIRADIYVNQGRHADAEPLVREIYDSYRKSRGRSDPKTIAAMSDTASLEMFLERYDQAEALYQRAMELNRRILHEAHPALADVPNDLGLFYLTRNRLHDAGPLLEESLRIRETVFGQMHPTTAMSVENLARLRDAEGNDAEAERLYDRSIAAYHAVPAAARDGCLRYAQRARFYHKTHRFEKALADLKRAIELSLEVRKHASGTDEQRSRTFAGFYTLFETMVDWQHEHGDLDEAYDAMERSRAQGLRDLIDTHGIDFFSGMNPVDEKRLRTEDARTRSELASIEKQLDKVDASERLTSAEKNRRKQELHDQLREAQRKFVEVQAMIRAASPVYRMTVGEDRKPIPLPTIQAELQKSKCIALEYLIGTEKSFVLIYGYTEQPRLLPLCLNEMEGKLFGVEADWLTGTKMDSILQNKAGTGILQLVLDEKHRTAAGNPDSETIAKLAALWNILIPDAGTREQLSDGKSLKQLLILPDGPLARLPFEMLVVEADPTTPQYLLDQGPATVYAPSASLYFNLKSKKRNDTMQKILTVGDPTYVAAGPPNETDEDSEDTLMAVSASRSFSRFGRLLPLPWTAREVAWIFDTCLKAGSTTTKLVKAEATEANVRKNMSGRQIVHLACHGLVDDSHGNLFGSLALTVGDPNDPKNDGFLTLAEMFSLDLQSCELAVLSACETNIGPNQHGEGTWSMGRGMLASGAKRAVTTNWQVADDASAYLVYDFIATIVDSRETDVAESLREAKRSIRNHRNNRDWRHPYYWAPFVLIGPN